MLFRLLLHSKFENRHNKEKKVARTGQQQQASKHRPTARRTVKVKRKKGGKESSTDKFLFSLILKTLRLLYNSCSTFSHTFIFSLSRPFLLLQIPAVKDRERNPNKKSSNGSFHKKYNYYVFLTWCNFFPS